MQTWVVLPTYNEAENITRMLDAIVALGLGLKIVVVDDASPDGTGDIVAQRAQADAAIQVLQRRDERGLGTAYLAGFCHAIAAGASAALTMDCDFSHDPHAIPALLTALEGQDLVIGSRYVPGGRVENWPAHRKLLSASANRFVRALFQVPVSDCTSGFRLYRTVLLETIPWQRMHSTGYSFLVETLYWAAQQPDFRVREVPICFVDRTQGQSKMGLREALYGMRNLLRLKMELRQK